MSLSPDIFIFRVLVSFASTLTVFTPIPTVALTEPAFETADEFRYELTFKLFALWSFTFKTVVEVAVFSDFALVDATKPCNDT